MHESDRGQGFLLNDRHESWRWLAFHAFDRSTTLPTMSDLGARIARKVSFLHGREGLLTPAVFLILTVVFFNRALVDSSIVIASTLASDLPLQFLPWRKFGFEQLSQGNLPLWNPHIFGGTPYFGGFQSALLYPPNWLHFIFPVGLAINWINALHVFAAGYFTNLWCRYRGLGVWASMLAGLMFMFSGAYIPRIYAGHLPHIAIMVWAPLLFLSIDLLIRGTVARGTLLGMVVMTMLLLAGHPQYVYYTGLAAGIYVAINVLRFKNIPLGLLGCAMIVLGGAGIAAVQLLTGLDAASESVRSGGISYTFASQFSFPPENILTALSPGVFGNLPIVGFVNQPETYFGRVYLWEVSLFVSLTGLILAIFGAIAAPWRMTRSAVILTIVCLILALGAHTPLHRILYDFLPGFSMFRGSSKFNFLVVLFVALLAGYGFDTLLRAKRIPISLLVISGSLLMVTSGLSVLIGLSSASGLQGSWGRAVMSIYEQATLMEEMTVARDLYRDRDGFFIYAGRVSSYALATSACVVGAIIIILMLGRRRFSVVYLLLPIALLELMFYAFSLRATSSSTPHIPAGWPELIATIPQNARILGIENENLGMWLGYDDAWGYDPSVQKRYAEMMWFAQGLHPKDATQYVAFRRNHLNIFPLMRIAAVLFDDPADPKIPTPRPMELAQLIPNAKVLNNRDDILWAIQPNEFDPRETVFLESDPKIKLTNQKSAQGTVKLIRQSTDDLEFQIDTPENAILLVTNSYSRNWRARSVGTSFQETYPVMPADWAFQAIPLMAGKHHLVLEYRPRLFVIGRAISMVSLLGFTAACAWLWWHGRSKSFAQTIDSKRPPTGQGLPFR